MNREWITQQADENAVKKLATGLSLNPITARLLLNRGIETPEIARLYFEPSLSGLPDPFLLPDMDTAVKRVIRALEQKERIGIFGDYDVDGVTGSALLASFLKEVGCDPLIELPDRMGDGYGLTLAAVRKFHEQGVGLIITVDNGARSVEEIDAAADLKIDVIVTDHHEAKGALPQALAILNPKHGELSPQFSDLSGCGVAFMFVIALRKRLRKKGMFSDSEPNLRQHLDLVALGTIADVMPLTGTNRILVRHGLDEIARSAKPGIAALIDVSGTNPARLTPDAVAFQLSPRINAAGRLGSAKTALELLLCPDPARAFEIARTLDSKNRERQRMEAKIVEEAILKLGADKEIDSRAALVLHSEGWHVGVIGIAAAKIAERFFRPAVIISRDLKPARGSARGIEGINLVDALSQCGDLLERYGGHAMAAGLSIDDKNIDAFAKRLDLVCKNLIPQKKAGCIKIDSIVAPVDINAGLVEEMSRLRPFGAGNPEPVLAMHCMDILDRRILSEKHLKLKVRAGGIVFDAIGFGMAESMSANTKSASIAFTPEFNTWNGITSVQLKMKSIRPYV